MKFTQAFYGRPYFQIVSGSSATDTLSPPNPDVLDERMRIAFETYSPQFAAIDGNHYVIPRIDVLSVLASVVTAVPRLGPLHDVIADQAPRFVMKLIDELPDLTLAIAYAQGQYELATGDHDEMSTAVSAASRVREGFLVALEALADRGHVPRERLAEVRRGTGYVDMANDVETLTAILREVWPKVGLRTLIEWKELDAASAVVAQLRALIGARAKAAADVSAVSKMRLAAFTVLARRWDEVRRVVTYVRWHEGDVDVIAPSLWARPKGARVAGEKKIDQQGGGETGRSEKEDGSGNGNGVGAMGGVEVKGQVDLAAAPGAVVEAGAVGDAAVEGKRERDVASGGLDPFGGAAIVQKGGAP